MTIKHGLGGYSNHKCRCKVCRLAWNQYHLRRRHKQPGYIAREAARVAARAVRELRATVAAAARTRRLAVRICACGGRKDRRAKTCQACYLAQFPWRSAQARREANRIYMRDYMARYRRRVA